MDHHAKEFYCVYSNDNPHGHFHRVIALHEEPVVDWQEAHELVPTLNRGWYELARLPVQDRIEFTREFWISKLPYHPLLTEFLVKFFGSLDDIGIYLIQKKYEDPFEAQMVYSLAGNSGFFHGNPPADENKLNLLQKEFSRYILPLDYLAFLKIHDGFSKQLDTGIVKSNDMKELNEIFQGQLSEIDALMTTKGKTVNPDSLIAFYQSFDLPFYQCFWGEWYPDQEMGNVYYSGVAKTISDPVEKADCIETMAFETFIDWLMFYLEQIG
ncbi:MAG: SMI1/KNR4 family protein [Parachlamydiaceae bacterium]|nr:SMI1/KNR4 family protein [Parachlamydiaceae bacterium]